MMNRLPCWIALAWLALSCAHPASGQADATAPAQPNAPTPAIQTAPGTAQVHGIVQDAEGTPVANAQVTLSAPGKLGERTITSAADGSFSFTGLPPSQYRITVIAEAFDAYTSAEFTLRPNVDFAMPGIALKITTSSSITVTATPEQIAAAQVHEEEQQRVVFVFPNFYTSYIWNAQPMSASQKYKLALRALIDPVQFFTVAATAGAEQYSNTYPDYGQGLQGYGKRFGAGMADATTSRLVGSAILPSLFHQDPRYFYQGSGSIRSRTGHALSYVVVCRGDNGNDQPCYSHLLGSLTAGAVANAYHPASSRGAALTFETFGFTLAGNAAGNLFREFLLRKLESIPRFANGKH